MPAFDTYLEKYDKDKDRRLSQAEFIIDKEMGEHFGWADADNDKFITLSEWNTIRNLGVGEYGTIAIRPGTARGQLDPKQVLWRFKKNLPYIPAPLVYQNVLYLVKAGGIVTSLDIISGRPLKEGRTPNAPRRVLRLAGSSRWQGVPGECRRQNHGPEIRPAVGRPGV